MIYQLWGDERAMAYLQGRGLTSETIEAAKLGYSVDGRFSDCIAIPYFDARGEWRLTRYRHLGDTLPKYEQPKGTSRHLYNVVASEEPRVAVCEGEFDALILGQIGWAAVAVPGAQAWQRGWRWLFRNCDLVVVITDADEAGDRAASKIAAQVGMVAPVERIELPAGLDVSDLYLKDPDELGRLLP